VLELEYHLFSKIKKLTSENKFVLKFRNHFRLTKFMVGNKLWMFKGLIGVTDASFGYESELIGKVVTKKNFYYRLSMCKSDFIYPQSLLRPLLPLAYITKKHVRVIDFGGGGGAQYFSASHLFSSSRLFSWRVVETETIVNNSSALANGDLAFYRSIGEATFDGFYPDLVIASSSLEYTKNPLETLRELINLDASYFYLTRSALTLGSNLITAEQTSRLKDNGPGPLPDEFQDCEIKYWIRVLPLNLVKQELSAKYDILFTALEVDNALNVSNTPVSQYGILAHRKSRD
jgi:putative methyltransferase (TIGR04325 family)